MPDVKALLVITALLAIVLLSCAEEAKAPPTAPLSVSLESAPPLQTDTLPAFLRAFAQRPQWLANAFQFPVGPPLAKGYYNAQPFGENQHLGDDWNGTGGGNSDLGDTVYVAAAGWVGQAIDHRGGWGNVIRVVHKLPATDSLQFVESLYAHLDTMFVERGAWVEKGSPIGTIGNAGGICWAHLHFEIRDEPRRPLGGGYGNKEGYLDPTLFVERRRK